MKICRGGFASLIREMCCLTLLHSSALCSWSEQDRRVLSPRNWLHSSWEYLFRLDLESRVSFECSSTRTAAHFQFSNVSLALGVSPSPSSYFLRWQGWGGILLTLKSESWCEAFWCWSCFKSMMSLLWRKIVGSGLVSGQTQSPSWQNRACC